LLLGGFELTGCQQAHGTALLFSRLLLMHGFLDVLGRVDQADFQAKFSY
jgi:hypothetical protein